MDNISDQQEAPTNSILAYRISAKIKWNRTGFFSSPNITILVTVVGGRWKANSQWTAYVDGAGHPVHTSAPAGYALPEAPEGALVGNLGNRTFYVGNRGRIPNTPDSQELLLTCNDDLLGDYGDGYSDNDGYLDVVITTQA